MTWISLAEAKAQLNKQPNVTVDDAELRGFMAAACGIVEEIKGHVEQVEIVETLDAYRERTRHHSGRYVDRWFLDLREFPVLSVSGLTRASQPITPVPSHDAGVVTVPGPGQYTVTYIAGCEVIPPADYRLAALELVTYLWRGSQLNASSGRPPIKGDQTIVVPGAASPLPYRVRVLLGVFGEVVPDRPVIA